MNTTELRNIADKLDLIQLRKNEKKESLNKLKDKLLHL